MPSKFCPVITSGTVQFSRETLLMSLSVVAMRMIPATRLLCMISRYWSSLSFDLSEYPSTVK